MSDTTIDDIYSPLIIRKIYEKCDHNYVIYASGRERVRSDFEGMVGFEKRRVYYVYCTKCLDKRKLI